MTLCVSRFVTCYSGGAGSVIVEWGPYIKL